jgi:hypothetical protein
LKTAVTKGSKAAFNGIAWQKKPPAEAPAKPKIVTDAPPKPPVSGKPQAEIPDAPKTKTAKKAFNADTPAIPDVPPKATQETAEGLVKKFSGAGADDLADLNKFRKFASGVAESGDDS